MGISLSRRVAIATAIGAMLTSCLQEPVGTGQAGTPAVAQGLKDSPARASASLDAPAAALHANANYCTKCHGGLDNGSGAPPLDLAGGSVTTSLSVGAHSAHVQAGPMALAFDCVQCHEQVAAVCSPLHMNGAVDVLFSPTSIGAARGASPSYTKPTCTSYCHGTTMLGGTNTHPTWNAVGTNQAACGTCHGIPPGRMPSATHPNFPVAMKCKDCHPEAMTTDSYGNNVLKANGGGVHVNGVVDATGGHGPGWHDPASPVGGQHGMNTYNGLGTISMDQYYRECTNCHGNPGGDFTVTGGWSKVSCGKCHAGFFVTTTPVGNKCGGYTTVPCTSCIWCHQ